MSTAARHKLPSDAVVSYILVGAVAPSPAAFHANGKTAPNRAAKKDGFRPRLCGFCNVLMELDLKPGAALYCGYCQEDKIADIAFMCHSCAGYACAACFDFLPEAT
jgi:hypothetical protein